MEQEKPHHSVIAQTADQKRGPKQNAGGDDTDRIPTNLRTLLILENVAAADRALTPTEINRMLGLPKQSIHRLCATLVDEGFLVYEPDGRHLRPARRLRQMAGGLLFASRLHIARHQILEGVAIETGETVNFVVPEENGMNYVDRVETNWPFRVQLPVGTHVPFHCTASGKTFLAFLPRRAQKTMLALLALERYTANTIVEHGRLEKELRQIKKTGYALDREEFMDNMMAIAVPVYDGSGRYLAALAFHGPTLRLDETFMLDKLDYLKNAAKKLTKTLTEH